MEKNTYTSSIFFILFAVAPICLTTDGVFLSVFNVILTILFSFCCLIVFLLFLLGCSFLYDLITIMLFPVFHTKDSIFWFLRTQWVTLRRFYALFQKNKTYFFCQDCQWNNRRENRITIILLICMFQLITTKLSLPQDDIMQPIALLLFLFSLAKQTELWLIKLQWRFYQYLHLKKIGSNAKVYCITHHQHQTQKDIPAWHKQFRHISYGIIILLVSLNAVLLSLNPGKMEPELGPNMWLPNPVTEEKQKEKEEPNKNRLKILDIDWFTTFTIEV